MDEKLDKIRQHLQGARYELPQMTTDDPALFAAIEHLIDATDWLLSAVEQMADTRAAR